MWGKGQKVNVTNGNEDVIDMTLDYLPYRNNSLVMIKHLLYKQL